MIMVEKGKEGAGKEKNGSGSYKSIKGAPHWVLLSVIPPTKLPRQFRPLSQPDNEESSCSPICSYRLRTPRGSTPRGETQKSEALDLQGLRSGGDSWNRTNDPFDVNEVLCLGGKVCEKQMLGVHMPKNVDIIGFSHFLPHPSGVRRMGVHGGVHGCSWVGGCSFF